MKYYIPICLCQFVTNNLAYLAALLFKLGFKVAAAHCIDAAFVTQEFTDDLRLAHTCDYCEKPLHAYHRKVISPVYHLHWRCADELRASTDVRLGTFRAD